MTDHQSNLTAPKPEPVQVRALIDPQAMKQALRYSSTDLSSAMMEQASHYADYGVILAAASRQVGQVKLLLEVQEAKVDRIIREQAAGAGEKITEPALEKRIARDESVIKIKKALIEAKHIEDLAKTAVQAFSQRKDMLVQSGATERKEMEGEVRMQFRTAAEQVHEDKKANLLARFTPAPVSEAV